MKNKQYYFDLGYEWANKNAKDANPLALGSNNSWQALAFQDGVIKAMASKPIKVEKPVKCMAGIMEHLKFLRNNTFGYSGNLQTCPARFDRMVSKAKKLCKKHNLDFVKTMNSFVG